VGLDAHHGLQSLPGAVPVPLRHECPGICVHGLRAHRSLLGDRGGGAGRRAGPTLARFLPGDDLPGAVAGGGGDLHRAEQLSRRDHVLQSGVPRFPQRHGDGGTSGLGVARRRRAGRRVLPGGRGGGAVRHDERGRARGRQSRSAGSPRRYDGGGAPGLCHGLFRVCAHLPARRLLSDVPRNGRRGESRGKRLLRAGSAARLRWGVRRPRR